MNFRHVVFSSYPIFFILKLFKFDEFLALLCFRPTQFCFILKLFKIDSLHHSFRDGTLIIKQVKSWTYPEIRHFQV